MRMGWDGEAGGLDIMSRLLSSLRKWKRKQWTVWCFDLLTGKKTLIKGIGMKPELVLKVSQKMDFEEFRLTECWTGRLK